MVNSPSASWRYPFRLHRIFPLRCLSEAPIRDRPIASSRHCSEPEDLGAQLARQNLHRPSSSQKPQNDLTPCAPTVHPGQVPASPAGNRTGLGKPRGRSMVQATAYRVEGPAATGAINATFFSKPSGQSSSSGPALALRLSQFVQGNRPLLNRRPADDPILCSMILFTIRMRMSHSYCFRVDLVILRMRPDKSEVQRDRDN